jgi:hypothetical protein
MLTVKEGLRHIAVLSPPIPSWVHGHRNRVAKAGPNVKALPPRGAGMSVAQPQGHGINIGIELQRWSGSIKMLLPTALYKLILILLFGVSDFLSAFFKRVFFSMRFLACVF